ncbi:hypothetical protein [Sphingomonas bacterium]|uniref:hypothetical protein n=1 Tax=Sphingomonas bacterium TaxID=1895847 RepID=UPI00260F61DA|nr:hypothetical protein [Sphingomonas bacterium]MDB5678998.1 hypothetical protein [Sphingomonas bacterium]
MMILTLLAIAVATIAISGVSWRRRGGGPLPRGAIVVVLAELAVGGAILLYFLSAESRG